MPDPETPRLPDLLLAALTVADRDLPADAEIRIIFRSLGVAICEIVIETLIDRVLPKLTNFPKDGTGL